MSVGWTADTSATSSAQRPIMVYDLSGLNFDDVHRTHYERPKYRLIDQKDLRTNI